MQKRDELLMSIQATGSTPLRATQKRGKKYQLAVYVTYGTHRAQQVHSTPNCFTKGMATKTCTLQCRDVYFEPHGSRVTGDAVEKSAEIKTILTGQLAHWGLSALLLITWT